MGSKNKLKKFNENLNFQNLFQPSRDDILKSNFKFKGRWNDYFENSYPITLELGCGKGEYSFELAKKYHNRNFIGIEIDKEYFNIAKKRIESNSYQSNLLSFS